jgi:hypothetical protein
MGIVYWSPLSIFVSLNKELYRVFASLNKDKELGGGGGDQNLCSCFACWGGGGFENFTCLKRGATKKYYNCRVSPQSPPVQ